MVAWFVFGSIRWAVKRDSICKVSITHSVPHSLMTLDLLELCVCFDVIFGLSFVLAFIYLLFSFVYETDNKIGDEGAKAIAEALKCNTMLKKLYLSSKYHTHSLPHSLMILDLILHHGCVRRRRKERKRRMRDTCRFGHRSYIHTIESSFFFFFLQIRYFLFSRWLELCCIQLYLWFVANYVEILFVCFVCCFDVILWLFFVLTFIFLPFFSCMKQKTRSETTV